jgi:hypothetical protein
MERLINEIKSNTYNIDKPLNNSYSIKKIITFEQGKLLRGHRGHISYHIKDSKVVGLRHYNTYFGSIINSTYYFGTNKTHITVTKSTLMSKYLKEFYNKITENNKHIYNPNQDLQLSYYEIQLQSTVIVDDFLALNHWENIKLIKSVSDRLSKFKAIIKENGNDPEFIKNIVEYKPERFIFDDKYMISIAKSLYI